MSEFIGLGVEPALLAQAIETNAKAALQEDINTGDITAALIPQDKSIRARVITREKAVVCGSAWVDAIFSFLDVQYGGKTNIQWLKSDGDTANANDTLFEISGNARTLLTGERAALNLLQTLSATATLARQYADLVKGTAITLLDTRKTLPGLRIAQKYAVAVGGCHNHRIGLWDAFLIKENHICACGGISAAITQARTMAPGKPVQVEVETRAELEEALSAKADIIMLDNFSREDTLEILNTPAPNSVFEVSGNVELDNFEALPSCQPYRISVGALTKHLEAIDLSFRVIA
ncbi:carboxylating nicotinate-nucleotide diphosphorylase [Marinagarivorans cellulosilyticus]|uniref:nicotinate-nucleotide diphosphorylase (carboxylating) n=1 Tax=Marinagarivorans cellulosilyticus TaxID=2721545 RepID=A0AAN1WIL6_9GAMM|nr:carboxylating nicotinate-nucleotide diphosphorylase [Marinagarivorans cellulosilyticus]BCD98225.1 nicotinate-nucleotide pyrophosphorylase (carboxylating) [Marinagarivorans cellulosilyticus]